MLYPHPQVFITLEAGTGNGIPVWDAEAECRHCFHTAGSRAVVQEAAYLGAVRDLNKKDCNQGRKLPRMGE